MAVCRATQKIVVRMLIVLALIAIYVALSHSDVVQLSDLTANTLARWRQSTVINISF